MESKPIIGYWQIRGLAEQIRLMLTYIGVDFENKFYIEGPAPDFDKTEWRNDSQSLGLDFPNLPYLIDGDYKISETAAMIEYLALKYKPELTGETPCEKGLVKQIFGVLCDIKGYMTGTCYNPEFTTKIAGAMNDLKADFKNLSKYLCQKSFLLGEKVTYPDFLCLETLDMAEALCPGITAECGENFAAYRARIVALPNIQGFVSQQRLPWNNTIAQWR